ncbi:MAG: AzlD domain-containing protein [Limosilactobacillus gorillae]|jgi:branched-subunit amino acid transport protein|uniref:AzlD domain-containing protein n=1 Tax=Limosilactobacillus gorillae TaxID=1450649 RepID=UPI000A834D22|nr:AzlD domain-containing protein [Limosilactobacillus gorillae]MDO4855035.1 AzlD domain-containing protein [Limosilactobacillus gorillae]
MAWINTFNLAEASALIPSHHNLTYHLIVIVISAIAAFVPRYFPMRFFTNRKIPEWFNEWMKYVPISLFTALVIKGIFISSDYGLVQDHVKLLGNIMIYGHAGQIVAAIFVAITAYFTRSMAASVLVGLVGVWLFGLFL